MEIKFTALGGGDEIGANCYLISIDDFNLILDCGLHPRKKGKEMFPDLDRIKDLNVNDLIISHAHTDHVGSLPYLLKYFPHINIHCTKATLSAIEVTLLNTSRLLKNEFDESFSKDMIENYSEEVLNIIPMIVKRYDYNEKVHLTKNINFEFLNAGHIIGSAAILINAEDKKILYTGDINLRDQSLLPKARLPKYKVDILITECTNYDISDYPEYRSEIYRLTNFLNEIINKNGSILIPVFALGKSQEMLKRISELIDNNKIPNVPVYYSYMSEKIDQVYDMYNYQVDRVEKGFKLSSIKVLPFQRNDPGSGSFYNDPSILLLTSGMVIEKTASYNAAKKFLQLENFGIAMCGYCDLETPGFQIKRARKNEFTYLSQSEEGIFVKCSINNFRFSAHSRKQELDEMLVKVDPHTILIVHGDEDAVNAMGKNILSNNNRKRVISPERLKTYIL